MPLMQQWKQAGQIRYHWHHVLGVGQHGRWLAIMRHYPLDFVQVDYSLDNRDAAKTCCRWRTTGTLPC